MSSSKTRILISGYGLIAKQLTPFLLSKGYAVTVVSRRSLNIEGVQCVTWSEVDSLQAVSALLEVKHIIHLAGSNIGTRRWTERYKKEIISSRVETAHSLFRYFKHFDLKLESYISASGSNYYGSASKDVLYTENDEPGSDFLAGVCVQWEKACLEFKELGARTVLLRTAAVLSSAGGAIPPLKRMISFRVGVSFGNGNNSFAWIHIDDLCELYLLAIEKDHFEGPIHASAPEHLTYKEFLKALAKSMDKSIVALAMPEFLGQLALGERVVLFTRGNKLSTDKVKGLGMKFLYPNIKDALSNL